MKFYPVETLPGGIVQIRWSGIAPSACRVIQSLSARLKISAPTSTNIDLTLRPDLTPEEKEARITRLARSGDKMGAVKLTRQVYGSSLNEAIAYVEKIQNGPPAS